MTTMRTVRTIGVFAIAGLLVGMMAGWAPLAQDQEQTAQEQEQKAAQSKEMPMQCPMMASMKGMQMFADGPMVLLFRAKELELTDDQKKQLREIQKSARERAREVLTAEQQEMLQSPASQEALTVMKFVKMRMKKMMGEMMEQPKRLRVGNRMRGKMKSMCPSCMEMMGHKMMGHKQKQEPADKDADKDSDKDTDSDNDKDSDK